MIKVPYKFEPELSVEEFIKIGQLSLRWSHIEHVIGMCLKRILRLSDDEAIIMVFPLSLEQRLQRISQLAEITPLNDIATPVFDELKLIMPAIQYVRNNVIHAVVSEDPREGHHFTLHSKQRKLTKAQVFSVEELTNYAGHVTLAFRLALGFDFEPTAHSYALPDRPEIPEFLLSVFPVLRSQERA